LIQQDGMGDSTCGTCANKEDEQQKLQTKLVVGSSDDVYEQQANRVADQVMRMSESGENLRLQESNVANIQRQEDEETSDNPFREQIEMLLGQDGIQAKSENGDIQVTEDFQSSLSATKGGGQRMPNPIKTEMETAFGTDFSNVKLHTDSTAIQMSRQINAHAFTHGKDIYFNEGRFNSATKESKHLLAHELTHTLQQGGESLQRLSISRNSRTSGDCGSSRVRWTFSLDNPAPSDGYIVQKVTQLQTVEACPSNVSSISLTPRPPSPFWEAWPVSSGATVHQLQSTLGFTDQSSRGPGTNQSGTRAALGNVKFFLKSTTGDLGTYRTAPSTPGSSWGPGRAAPSGILPSTQSEPSWWSGTATEGPAHRWASAWWNCCNDASSNFSRIDSNP
jgi:hypothetical protein